jgi:hypothetical protein
MRATAAIILSTLFSIPLLTMTGCGPEKSELDLERERSRSRLVQKSAETESLIGEYSGWAFKGKTKVLQLTIVIDMTYEAVRSASGEPVMTPRLTVAGFFDSKTSSNADLIFPSADYFADIKTLVCASSASGQGQQLAQVEENSVGATELRVQGSSEGPARLVLDFSNRNPTGKYTSPRLITLPDGKKTLSLDVVLEKIN